MPAFFFFSCALPKFTFHVILIVNVVGGVLSFSYTSLVTVLGKVYVEDGGSRNAIFLTFIISKYF